MHTKLSHQTTLWANGCHTKRAHMRTGLQSKEPKIHVEKETIRCCRRDKTRCQEIKEVHGKGWPIESSRSLSQRHSLAITRR